MGINCLAIADHGTIEGALLLKKMAPFTVIIAEEIKTPYGEIMGLFLTKEIPRYLSVNDTIQQIQNQDGLVCIPHPGHLFRSSSYNINRLMDIQDKIDIIEVYNGHSYFPSSNNRAKQIATQLNKVPSAGSDAHTLKEIGGVCIEMAEFSTKEEFLVSLSHGKIIGHLANPFVHLFNTKNKIIKQLFN